MRNPQAKLTFGAKLGAEIWFAGARQAPTTLTAGLAWNPYETFLRLPPQSSSMARLGGLCLNIWRFWWSHLSTFWLKQLGVSELDPQTVKDFAEGSTATKVSSHETVLRRCYIPTPGRSKPFGAGCSWQISGGQPSFSIPDFRC